MPLTLIEVGELVPAYRELELRLVNPWFYPDSASSWAGITWYEMVILAAIAQQLRPQRIFEFGTLDGRTTLHLAANTPQGTVYTLDLPPGEIPAGLSDLERGIARLARPGLYFRDTLWAEQIVQLWGDSAFFDARSYAGQIDLVFVDGSKDDGYYQKDTENALIMAGDKGTILWHDYANRGLFPWFDRHLEALAQRERCYHVSGTFLAVRPGAGLNVCL